MKYFPSGLIIDFEGLDCSFKETNHQAFVERLKHESGVPNKVWVESFPRYGYGWSVVGVNKWLNGDLDRSHLMKHPKAVNSFYCIDRLSYWFETEEDKPNTPRINYLSEGHGNCFVFDRYTVSNAIYNPIHGDMTSVDDLDFDTRIFGIPMPNIVVWMRMRDFEVLKSLLAQKKNKDKNELDTTFLKKVWDRSEYVIKNNLFKEANIELVVIECLNEDGSIRTRDELAEDVWKQVMDRVALFKE